MNPKNSKNIASRPCGKFLMYDCSARNPPLLNSLECLIGIIVHTKLVSVTPCTVSRGLLIGVDGGMIIVKSVYYMHGGI